MAFRWEMNAEESDGTNWVTVVPSPPVGTRRIVRVVFVSNASGASIETTVALYDGTTYWLQWVESMTASGVVDGILGIFTPIVVKPTWSLVMKHDTAATSTVQYTVHWGEDIDEVVN